MTLVEHQPFLSKFKIIVCFRSGMLKDVPYSRLVEVCPAALPIKLDSDSKLHTDKGKLTVTVSPADVPKNSASDSKLAVDYFNTPINNERHNKEEVCLLFYIYYD